MQFQLCLLGHTTLYSVLRFILFPADESWEKRWIYSTSKGSDAGKFKLSAGKFYGDKDKDLG